MRLKISKSKNAMSFYVIKSYRTKDGKNTSKIVEKLGNLDEVTLKAKGEDPVVWAKKYIEKLNKKVKEENEDVIVKYSSTKQIESNKKVLYNGGYLFLQKIYYELKLDKICDDISSEYKFDFDLNEILSRLIYSRILYPASKLSTFENSKNYLEKSSFDLHQIYRALEVLAEKMTSIQSQVYKNSSALIDRKKGVLYYDCTNYFFEIEQEENSKQYGVSKEHRPNPIVQMGLLMDSDGLPLCFCINPGNTNEQVTLIPLEQEIIDDYEVDEFIMCTDAGLASSSNRKFNSYGNRSFITTQSIKKLKEPYQKFIFDNSGWKLEGSKKEYDISNLDEEKYYDCIFYKSTEVEISGMKQMLIVSYSIKYKKYQQKIRGNQIKRAESLIQNNSSKLTKANPNDCKRFITKTSVTKDGEVAEKNIYTINQELINEEAKYDGYYAVCTNLEDDPTKIVKINRNRWEIEECFRIMKTEFKARPVYLKRDDRIKAHFLTCFLALLVIKLLKKKLNNDNYTYETILEKLKEFNFLEVESEGYIPAYERDNLTDDLHEKFGFRTDTQIVKKSTMKKIFKITKN